MNRSFLGKIALVVVLSIWSVILSGTAHAQCLQSGGIGDFEMATLSDDWWNATQGNGTFSLDATDSYTGAQSLRADVSVAGSWQVRALNESCKLSLVGGITDTIRFYAKGDVGDNIDVALMDNWTPMVNQVITITSTSWQQYEVTLTPTATTSEGQLKFTFQDVGTYHLDNVEVVEPTVPASATAWYVSGGNGIDAITGTNGRSPLEPLNTLEYAVKTAWQPGDTIYVMDGIYQNAGYGDYVNSGGASGENNGAFLTVYDTDINTSANAWLVITNYPGHSPKIQFDGSGGIIMHRVSYVDISGLEIEGPNQQITKAQAEANRLIQDNYFSGRGIAIWGGTGYPHHINIHHMKVHDCPNSGIRVNDGDYVNLSYNEVYNNTWWSSNAESAIVIAQSKDFDTKDTIKMVMSYNKVHDNRNYIPYYNASYPPAGNCYGNACQDYIIDGSGVYITRNNPDSPSQTSTDYVHGWFYFANNITYNNGINGLVVHKSDRTIVTNNLAFMNGTVSKDPVASGGEGRQDAGGITINASTDVRVYNNISWVRYSDDYSYQNFGTSSWTASNNIGVEGLSAFGAGEYTDLDPAIAAQMFSDTTNKDFHLVAGATAIDAGIAHTNLPETDFDGNPHVGTPDIGPYEFSTSTTGEVSLLDPNICWEGVIESELTGSDELRTFRFPKNYATTDVSGYYTALRAASSAGVVMKIKTSSPTVDVSFAEDLTWAGDVFWHRIAVYKDGVYQFNTNNFDINLTNPGGASVEWKFILPVYTQMNLKSIQLEPGNSLEPIDDCDTKPVYLAIGNSITMGVGVTENDSRHTYSRLIADSEGYELYNWGIGGSKVYEGILDNLSSGIQPDLITILWGYNDVHYSGNDNYLTNNTFPQYEAILDTLCRRFPSAKVMAILPTYTTNPTNTAARTIPILSDGELAIIQSLQSKYSNLCYINGWDYTDVSGLNDAVHLNDNGNASLAAGVIANLNSCSTSVPSTGPLAECKGKFLGNIMRSAWQGGDIVRPDFGNYWNQVTPSNAGKWSAVEWNQDNFNWADLDSMYNYCEANNIPFKQHVFVWGTQQPNWIGGLSTANQEIQWNEYVSAFAARYPNTAIIDVVNESIDGHAPPLEFIDALGGFNDGASNAYLAANAAQYGPYGTGWDYIIYAFAKTREAFPNATLVLNDYHIINDLNGNIDKHLEIVNILNDRGLIDAVGMQCHNFSIGNMSAAQLQNNLDLLAAPGLPLHITELDLGDADDQAQLDKYEELFPVLWEHPSVEGITLWGYAEGEMWEPGGNPAYTELVMTDGTERPALTWLRQYMASQPDVCTPGCTEADLGADVSLCGVSSVDLNSNLGVTNRTFTWMRDGVVISGATSSTYTATQSGTYIVSADSSGCVTTDTIEVSDELPTVDLGPDVELCSPSEITLDAGVSGGGISYAWEKDGQVISGATQQTFQAIEAGNYTVTLSASGCANVTDLITITSSLLDVAHDTICSAGLADLSVSGTSTYDWYDQLNGGTQVATGNTYSPNVSSTTTYYVEDAAGVSALVGMSAPDFTNNRTWYNSNFTFRPRFVVSVDLTIDSISVWPQTANNVTVQVRASDNTTVLASQNFTNITAGVENRLPVDFNLSAGTYYLDFTGTGGNLAYSNENDPLVGYPYTVNGVISIEGAEPSWFQNTPRYAYAYNWRVSAGNSCDRTLVRAVIDPTHSSCGGTLDCNGDPGGTAYLDNCGTCVEGNTGNTACTQDCNGDWGGTAYLDNCGTCVEGNTGNTACTQDCNGDWGGTAYLDNCGTCVEGNTGNVACTQDCNGDWGGTAYLDNCGTCVEGNTGNMACTQDCNGDWGGTAYLDNCGTCVEGNTGNTACTQDCNGDWGGTAYLDNCGTCVEGNTGNVACTQDCNGDWGGTAYIDGCSNCVAGNTGQLPCDDDCAGVPGGSAYVDNCGVCVAGTTGNIACTQDCNGDWGGAAVIDNCGTCAGGNSGNTACTQDCNGDWGGTASIDNCSVCSGGNTGIVVDDCLTPITDGIESDIKVYPVPVLEVLHVEYTGADKSWYIYNALGVIVKEGTTRKIEAGDLASGLYFLKIDTHVFEIIKE